MPIRIFLLRNLKIIGTDISTTLLERAEEGKYSQHEVNQGLPAALLLRNFDKMGIHWIVKKEHRDRVEFRPLNLVEPWGELPTLDIIFLRNYFLF